MALVSADAHLPTHGGLTPAAPGTVRQCIANIVFSPADTRTPTQERGASAPRGRPSSETQRTGGTQAPLATASAHPTNCGSRQPPVALINANATAIRTHTVGGLPTNGARVCRCAFAHPRRAYARRSWYCAFSASQTSFFRRQTFAHQHKSGEGVSPPWPAIVRDRTNRRNTSAAGNRIRTSDQLREPSAPRGANKRERNGNPHTHTVGGLPTNGARVCRCAFAHPRRAYASRSW
jgi:hypothetical protein